MKIYADFWFLFLITPPPFPQFCGTPSFVFMKNAPPTGCVRPDRLSIFSVSTASTDPRVPSSFLRPGRKEPESGNYGRPKPFFQQNLLIKKYFLESSEGILVYRIFSFQAVVVDHQSRNRSPFCIPDRGYLLTQIIKVVDALFCNLFTS